MFELPIFNTAKKYPVNPGKIIALGKNYLDHIAEVSPVDACGSDAEVPAEPILFAKTPNVLIGPEESIIIPRFIYDYDFAEVSTHYEAELAFFIKKAGKAIRYVTVTSGVLLIGIGLALLFDKMNILLFT